MTVPSKAPLILQWWPVLVSLSIVLVHGVFARADIDEQRRRVSKLETVASEHDKAISEGRERLRLLEADSARHAQTTALILDKLARIEANIAVLCQSVQGAQCVR